MKHIEVVAAIICHNKKFFATQRGYGPMKDGWEFPGGKIENGESPENALKREIREELSTEIEVEKLFCSIEHDYPDFLLTMHCYICKVKSGNLELKEHEAARWLNKNELGKVHWLPADWKVVEKLQLIDK
ncbi:MAG: (deoxy)nucleoside triphosphate pyrophosphohydrolase [Alloprevotella sp.]|nr:(deoxy)nucleoside triphosphate pyrophosphohydrolase [Alloprevotella sp.]MBR1428335.1 (deoxy)nucleoside triphosphate pyrophosphohydrolase [Prevotella sp.]